MSRYSEPVIKTKRLRREVGYEIFVPLCRTCMNYKAPMVFLRDSLPQVVGPAICKEHGFSIEPDACCDHWSRQNKNGEIVTLEVKK